MTKQQHYPPTCSVCGASLPHNNPMSREYHEQQQARKQDKIYRWVEPEIVWFDDDGNKVVIPEHQEQGRYIHEANIQGYIIVELQDGRKHLVKDSDIVAILS